MLREMRRTKRVLSIREVQEILNATRTGVLSVNGDDGYPYAVPISFLYDDRHVYFHSGKHGHKIESIVRDERVSFCVLAEKEEEGKHSYQSVIIFGHAHIVEDEKTKRWVMQAIAKKYMPGRETETDQNIERKWNAFEVVAIEILRIDGKEPVSITI